MSIQWPAFSEFWVPGFLIGMLAAVSYYKGVFFQGFGRFLKFTGIWGATIVLIGFWPPLVGVEYSHPTASLSAGISGGFFALAVAAPIFLFICFVVIGLFHLLLEYMPPRGGTGSW